MATFTGSFELRRLLVKWSRGPSGGTSEDQDIVTFHFAKVTSGAVDPAWTAGNYTTVENAFDSMWTAMLGTQPTFQTLNEYRWFKDGPTQSPADLANGPANPAERITARSVAATGSSAALPPQVAISVTEVVPIRKRWGRFYLPAPVVTVTPTNIVTTEGRIATSFVTTRLGQVVTFYNTCRAASLIPVVFSRGRSAYVTPRGNSIAAHSASAYEIESLQIDNLYDVIRTRRYDGPTNRQSTVLT